MLKKNITAKLKITLMTTAFVLVPMASIADCQSWESGKYKASESDSDAMDDAVKDAFKIQNAKGALVSFNKCVFLVKPRFEAKMRTFDYSKDKKKCSAVKAVFEMNLIGCEQTFTTSGSKNQTSGVK